MTVAHKFRLSPAVRDAVASLASDLTAEAEDHQSAWDDRSERWQEGEAGSSAAAWIESLGELADALESFPEEPE